MALQLLDLADLKAYSALAEVQALTSQTLEPLERIAINLLQGELGRRITLDTSDVEREVFGGGNSLVPLPERLDSLTSIETEYDVDLTSYVALFHNGWSLRFTGFLPTGMITVTGKWGWDTSAVDQILDVLMDVVCALAVRQADPISTRNEKSAWSDVNDGSLRANRGMAQERKITAENLLTYDLKLRLSGCYRPSRISVL